MDEARIIPQPTTKREVMRNYALLCEVLAGAPGALRRVIDANLALPDSESFTGLCGQSEVMGKRACLQFAALLHRHCQRGSPAPAPAPAPVPSEAERHQHAVRMQTGLARLKQKQRPVRTRGMHRRYTYHARSNTPTSGEHDKRASAHTTTERSASRPGSSESTSLREDMQPLTPESGLRGEPAATSPAERTQSQSRASVGTVAEALTPLDTSTAALSHSWATDATPICSVLLTEL